MDPNACLSEIRKLTEKLQSGHAGADDDIDRLCELIEAMDNWMTGGGFLPTEWTILRKH